jgi:hypothetical protein
MMDYACPAWRSAAHTHVYRLQVLLSKCLHLATGAPWYVSNRQIHENLGVPLFSKHIRAPTASFDSKLADMGNPLVQQLGRYLHWPRVDPITWHESQGRQGSAGQSRPSPMMAKSTKRIAFGADQPSAFRLPWLRFLHDFSSVVRQMPGYTMQSRGTACTPLPHVWRLHLSAWRKLHTSSLRLSQSGLRTQTANQPKFILPIISPGPPRR